MFLLQHREEARLPFEGQVVAALQQRTRQTTVLGWCAWGECGAAGGGGGGGGGGRALLLLLSGLGHDDALCALVVLCVDVDV